MASARPLTLSRLRHLTCARKRDAKAHAMARMGQQQPKTECSRSSPLRLGKQTIFGRAATALNRNQDFIRWNVHEQTDGNIDLYAAGLQSDCRGVA